MPELTIPQDNHLLAALSKEVQARIFPHLELVTLSVGQVVYESGDILHQVFFPTDSIISMLYEMENGASAEISVIGNDGMVGLALLMGGDSMPSRAVVLSTGQAYQIKAKLLKEEFFHHGELEQLMLRFTQSLLTQMSQTAACNRHHSIDQQLCRWILLSLDRLPTEQLNMTHELIANMLGVRREGVTAAAGKLQRLGVIKYCRGRITVLDRPKLEELSCECYAVVKRESDRLLPHSKNSRNHLLSRSGEITATQSAIALRQSAEVQLKYMKANPSKYDAKKVLHELQVHQIELEMQNEELQRSRKIEIESVQRYADLFDFAPVGYFVIESTGIISQLNLRGASLLGLARANLIGRQFSNYVTAQSRAVFKKFLARVFEENGPHRCEILMQVNQSECWLSIEANLGTSDTNCFALMTDISERKRAEEKLARAASVFSHADEGIIIADPAGNIIEVNEAFSQITGYASSEVVGKNPRFLKSGRHPPEFYTEMWAEIIEKGHWRGEIWCRRKNGEIYAEMITISAAKNAKGEVQHYVSLSTDITPTKVYQRQLERNAHYDALTNLPNRVLLADRLNQAMTQSQRRNRLVAVVFMDLDGFKAVNDAHGHKVGDELLIAVSLRMKEALREGDTLARVGGDEFIAVMVDLESAEDSEIVLERLLKAAADPITIDDAVMQVSASIGVTIYPQDSCAADQLIRHADQAMYIAKKSGKNRYHLFETPND